MNSHHFHRLTFTAWICDVVTPTLTSSEKIDSFSYLLAVFPFLFRGFFFSSNNCLLQACKNNCNTLYHQNILSSGVEIFLVFYLHQKAMHERWWKVMGGCECLNKYSQTPPTSPKQLDITNSLFLSFFLFFLNLTFLAPALPRSGHIDSKWHFKHRGRSQAQYIIKRPH